MMPIFKFTCYQFASVEGSAIPQEDFDTLLELDALPVVAIERNREGILLRVGSPQDPDMELLRDQGFSDRLSDLLGSAHAAGIPYMFIRALGDPVIEITTT